MIFITERKRNHAFKIQENSSLCVDLYYSAWLVNFSQPFLTFQWWCLNTNCVSYRQELISEIKKNSKILKSCIQKKGPEKFCFSLPIAQKIKWSILYIVLTIILAFIRLILLCDCIMRFYREVHDWCCCVGDCWWFPLFALIKRLITLFLKKHFA